MHLFWSKKTGNLFFGQRNYASLCIHFGLHENLLRLLRDFRVGREREAVKVGVLLLLPQIAQIGELQLVPNEKSPRQRGQTLFGYAAHRHYELVELGVFVLLEAVLQAFVLYLENKTV